MILDFCLLIQVILFIKPSLSCNFCCIMDLESAKKVIHLVSPKKGRGSQRVTCRCSRNGCCHTLWNFLSLNLKVRGAFFCALCPNANILECCSDKLRKGKIIFGLTSWTLLISLKRKKSQLVCMNVRMLSYRACTSVDWSR